MAATSATNAWAVGYSGTSSTTLHTLLLHWNGAKWSPVTTPKPVAGELYQVSAVSATDAWAVGDAGSGDLTPVALMLRWNGKTWSRQILPGTGFQLFTVTAYRGGVWAAGYAGSYGVPVLLHWVSGRWSVIPVPIPKGIPISGSVQIAGVAMTGSSSGWMISTDCDLWRWNGAFWKLSSLPLPTHCGAADDAGPAGITAGPRGTAWVTPGYGNGTGTATNWFWNGRSWHAVVVPTSANLALFWVPVVLTDGSVWALASCGWRSFCVARWTGKAWQQAGASVSFSAPSELATYIFAMSSPHDAWFVSGNGTFGDEWTTIMHWNGKTWS